MEAAAAAGQKRASLRGSSPVASHAAPRHTPVQPKSAIPEYANSSRRRAAASAIANGSSSSATGTHASAA